MKKMGRPKAENLKNVNIMVRVDKDTEQKLVGYCNANSITRAEAVRRSIMLLMGEIEGK